MDARIRPAPTRTPSANAAVRGTVDVPDAGTKLLFPVDPRMHMANEDGRRIRAVRIACALLDALDRRGQSGVTELATALGHSKSTVYSHLETLDEAGRVTKSEGEYRLSYQQLGVAERLRQRIPGLDTARRELADLAASTGEVALFSTAEDGRLVYLHRSTGGSDEPPTPRQAEAWPVNLYETGQQENDVVPTVGSTAPLHCTAGGKAILAHSGGHLLAVVLEQHGLERRTHNTITDRDTLRTELEQIDREGHALEDEERVPGMRSLGVAVVTGERPVGAVCLLGPASRLSEGRLVSELQDPLVETAETIAAAIE